MSTDAPEYRLFLENYPLLCPNLKSIKFDFYCLEGSWALSQPLSQAIRSNTDWQHAEIYPPSDGALFKHLGMSSTLKSVSLNLPSQTRLDQAYFGPQDTPFCNVTDLALKLWDSLDVATGLLRSHDQVFRSFRVALTTRLVPTEVSAFIIALTSPQRVHSLQSISLTAAQDFRPTSVHQQFSFETFRPLVPLVHLRIYLDHPTSLSDDEFAELVRNWPRLQVLRVTWAFEDSGHPTASITLKGLLSLLASCRRLCDVALTLDARDVPMGAYAHADKYHPWITSPIMFRNSPIKHPDLVADFLLKHLPSRSVPGVEPVMTWSSLGPADFSALQREYTPL